MGFVDLLKPSRARFAPDPESDDESKTAFLNDKAPRGASDRGKATAVTRSVYWTMYCFLVLATLLLSITVFQGRGAKEQTEFWSQDILGKGTVPAFRMDLAVELD